MNSLCQVPPGTPVAPHSSGRGQQFYEPMENNTLPGIGRGKKKEKKQEKEQIRGKLGICFPLFAAHTPYFMLVLEMSMLPGL